MILYDPCRLDKNMFSRRRYNHRQRERRLDKRARNPPNCPLLRLPRERDFCRPRQRGFRRHARSHWSLRRDGPYPNRIWHGEFSLTYSHTLTTTEAERRM